jgi:hypothetical protein
MEQLLKSQRWALDERRRQVADFETLIAKLNHDLVRIDRMLANEIERARQSPELQRALPAYHRAVAERQSRLRVTISGLHLELESLREKMTESFSEMKKTEQIINQRLERQRRLEERRESARLDAIQQRRYAHR